MSIQDLEKRMNQSLDRINNRGELTLDLPQPYRLQSQLIRITQKFRILEDSKPSSEKILLAIEKLEQTSADALSRRDWRNVAWGLSLKFDHRPQKLIFSNQGRQAIDHFQQSDDIGTSTYLALLFSYFTLEQSEIDTNLNHWIALRTTLKNKLPVILKKVKYQSEWMQILNQHHELLENNPTRQIAKVFLENSDNESITELTEKLRIPSNGWFWNLLITEVMQSIFKMTDQSYIAYIETLLALSSKHPIYKNLILSNILDRHARTKTCDQIHDTLKTVSLDTWGNPQSESTSGWLNVKPDTKKMVVKWFVRADLEAFFKLFCDEHTDIRRFNYWMRFINQISYTQLILSPSAIQSNKATHIEFKKKNSVRIKSLSKSTYTNNAFVLRIGNIYIVEFSEKGNACYVYKNIPYGPTLKEVNISNIKNTSRSIIYMSHHNGYWESTFDRNLISNNIGISPDSQKIRH